MEKPAEYSADQLAEFMYVFATAGARYRRNRARAAYLGLGGFFLAAACIWRGQAWYPVGVIALLLSFLSAIILSALSSLRCPACKRQIPNRAVNYCPQCAAQLPEHGFLHSLRCPHCKAALNAGKSRSYTIHACTYCGVLLDEKGF